MNGGRRGAEGSVSGSEREGRQTKKDVNFSRPFYKTFRFFAARQDGGEIICTARISR